VRDDGSDLVELCRVWGDAEAMVISALLADNGIACHVTGHADHKVHPFSLDGLGEVILFVHPDRLAEARALLSVREREDP